jgi:DNA-binding GntR family transcriptional regulator
MCAAECARRPDRREEVVPVLRANVEASAELVGDGVAFTHVAREFHDLVVALTPNATVRYVVSSLVALWSAQEETWAEVLTTRGEYPSNTEARRVVRTHRRVLDEIAAGRAGGAERMARTHLAATQALLLERFGDGIVNASSARARQAIQANRHEDRRGR